MRKQTTKHAVITMATVLGLSMGMSLPVFAEGEEVENSLVIYTAEPDSNMEPLIAGFNEVYPDCEVEVIYGSAGDMTSRIIAESADPQCDVMFSGLNAGDGDAYKDYFEEYVSVHDEEMIEDCKSNNGYYNYVIISPAVLYVNNTLLEEAGVTVKNYQDLLQPELEGMVVSADPNSSSAAWNNLANILADFGYESEETWDYIDKLLGNGLVITSSSSTVFTSVTNGEYAVGLTYETGATTQLYDGAEDCEIIYPEEGGGYIVTAAAIVKDCKHPEAAKAWIDYTASAEGQTEWATTVGTIRPTNANATYESEFMQPFDSINWVTRDNDYLTSHKNEILEKWNELYNKHN
ncbi:MAG: extracellular solute-binding protein [Lachnospiraceae bacterium]|nr:extracellular solute-binding protein [Lachnospiraceae bacterium]